MANVIPTYDEWRASGATYGGGYENWLKDYKAGKISWKGEKYGATSTNTPTNTTPTNTTPTNTTPTNTSSNTSSSSGDPIRVKLNNGSYTGEVWLYPDTYFVKGANGSLQAISPSHPGVSSGVDAWAINQFLSGNVNDIYGKSLQGNSVLNQVIKNYNATNTTNASSNVVNTVPSRPIGYTTTVNGETLTWNGQGWDKPGSTGTIAPTDTSTTPTNNGGTVKEGDTQILGSNTFIYQNGKWVYQGATPPDYENGSPEPDFDEYLTFDAYLEGLPDGGASLITQWEELAEQQIGDDYTKLKQKLAEQFDLFKAGQNIELNIADEAKARNERYLTEDLNRFKEYASADRITQLAEVDDSFAKALSSAASGYFDRGISLSPMKLAYGEDMTSQGLQNKAASLIREDVTPVRKKIETAYTRGVADAETDAERGGENLAAGYDAFKARQGQALDETSLKKATAETEYDVDKARLKAGLVAARKAEERYQYTADQMRKFY